MKKIAVFVLLLFLTGCANLGNRTRPQGQQRQSQRALDHRQRTTDQLDREYESRKLKRELRGNY